MDEYSRLDAVVRARLRNWPQRPPGLNPRVQDAWLRGRPAEKQSNTNNPFLKLPGSNRKARRTAWSDGGGHDFVPALHVVLVSLI